MPTSQVRLLEMILHVSFLGYSVAIGAAVTSHEATASSSARLQRFYKEGMAALADTAADAEMGEDLDLGNRRYHGAPSSASAGSGAAQGGPATLAAYCAGDTHQEHKEKLQEGTKVMADWENYGTMYPGKVSEKNPDGTVDIHYDDGFDEKNVKAHNVKPVEDKDEKKTASLIQTAFLIQQLKPAKQQRNDPACEMQEFLQKLQERLGDLDPMISQWLAAQRAKLAKTKSDAVAAPPQMNPVIAGDAEISAASPSAAPPGVAGAPSPALNDDIEELKAQLAERDARIAKLRKQKEENDIALQKHLPASAAPAANGTTTIDELIASYKARIAQRDSEIKELLRVIQEQEQQLSTLGAKQLSLKDIDAAVQSLEKDAEAARQKRDQMKKDGKLDDDLAHILDEILEDLEKLREKVNNLLALDANAKDRAAAADRKAKQAVEAARAKAKKEGEDPDKAAAQAAKLSKAEAEGAAEKSELETLKAAQEVKKDLDEAGKGAAKLDTGLHPHGSKWWRYRYEHSYIESMLMIFISFLMLFWSRIMHHLKHHVRVRSLAPEEEHKTQIEEMDEEMHGTFYNLWLKLFAEQMMVCILVFLTVWVLGKTHVFESFPMILKPSPDMHVPTTGEEYQELAFDICTVFFFSILFYFCLMFSVAHDTEDMTRALENKDKGSQFAHLAQAPVSAKRASAAIMGTLKRSTSGFDQCQNHFVNAMDHEMKTRQEPAMKEICTLLDNDIDAFPLWKYLILNIRLTMAGLLEFSWTMWIPVVASFSCFMVLHRSAHMGYVRIMVGFTVLLVAIIIAIALITKKMSQMLSADYKPHADDKHDSIHETMNTESILLCVFQFALFFMCYGIARMICQPWMWQLHFWPVLGLTIAALVNVVVFILLVSPALPSFCAVMALPPFVDEHNLDVMLHVAKGVRVTSMSS